MENELREWLKPHVIEELRRLVPTLLDDLETVYDRNKNPIAAWYAINLCTRCNLPLPPFALKTLAIVQHRWCRFQNQIPQFAKRNESSLKLLKI